MLKTEVNIGELQVKELEQTKALKQKFEKFYSKKYQQKNVFYQFPILHAVFFTLKKLHTEI